MSLEPGNNYFLDLYLEDENFSSIDFGYLRKVSLPPGTPCD